MANVTLRMAVLFVLGLFLTLWQAARIEPVARPAYVSVVERSEQVYPAAVPAWKEPKARAETAPRARTGLRAKTGLPATTVAPERRQAADRVLDWQPGTMEASECQLLIRVSLHHWVRLGLSRERLALLLAEPPPQGSVTVHIPSELRLSPHSFLDDDDRDGDPLDAGELSLSGPGAQVEQSCW